jgi:hypothetical protein
MKRVIAIAAMMLLAGCAAMQERQAANRAEFERTIPVCSGAEQCKVAWAVARNWVIQNCGMKIQNIADGYIETYGSADTRLACRVMGEPRGPDTWALVMRTGCGNPFGCVPDAWDAALRFNNAIGSSLPKPAPAVGYAPPN